MIEKRPELTELQIADPAERWRALGFSVEGNRTTVGGISIQLGGPGHGITSWAIRNLASASLDGLPTTTPSSFDPPPTHQHRHSNGAIGIDHVVIISPDFDGTARQLEQAGMPLRRIRDAGAFRQGFRRLGPAILELVEAREAPPGPARFWGLVVIVEDLQRLVARLPDEVTPIRHAVQPGRRITTLRDGAGLSTKLAFMDPEPASAS